MRRAALIAVLAALLAGCGGEKTVEPLPETVETTATATQPGTTTTEGGAGGGAVKGDAAAGKALFAANGCGSCHTFQPAGSSGTTGPDLDKLADYAKRANKPVAEFTRESIENPSAYVEQGYPQGVMPTYDQLTPKQLNDLVAFLTQS
ncbi:MAG TPA: c-type cytochrome [Gaiellaceae bacterium]|nr:c-type cytochrome [Gaiellaceae bacterium]